MKIRTEEQLAAYVDNDYTWRFMELSTIEDAIRRTTGTSKTCFIRAGIAILYAHWEGFIKYAAESYLFLISGSKSQLDHLDFRFVGLAFKNIMASLGSATLTSEYGDCVKHILENQNSRLRIPVKNIIKTHSNLSSRVLRQIADIIGIDYSVFELKEKIIDGKLLYYRNTIAHGNFLEIDQEGFEELLNQIVGMLEMFKDQVLKCAQNRTYLRASIAI